MIPYQEFEVEEVPTCTTCYRKGAALAYMYRNFGERNRRNIVEAAITVDMMRCRRNRFCMEQLPEEPQAIPPSRVAEHQKKHITRSGR